MAKFNIFIGGKQAQLMMMFTKAMMVVTTDVAKSFSTNRDGIFIYRQLFVQGNDSMALQKTQFSGDGVFETRNGCMPIWQFCHGEVRDFDKPSSTYDWHVDQI